MENNKISSEDDEACMWQGKWVSPAGRGKKIAVSSAEHNNSHHQL